MSEYLLRQLNHDDIHLGYLELLKQVSEIDQKKISFDDFDIFVGRVNKNRNHHIYVIEDKNSNIIGSGTLLIEPKLIHNISYVGHIEDIVIDSAHRGNGLGKLIINKLQEVAKENKCYKVTLYCDKDNIKFYEKNNMRIGDVQMVLYFKDLK